MYACEISSLGILVSFQFTFTVEVHQLQYHEVHKSPNALTFFFSE